MRRREFIAGLGGAAAWPLRAGAQQGERVRRLGVLHMGAEGDHGSFAQVSRLIQGLAELGWIDGRNLRIDVRWAAGNVDRMKVHAKELVDQRPDVIFGAASAAVVAAKRETETIPIVFANVSDPVGDGFVASLSRPGGNITGFINIEAGMGGKFLELLSEIAPAVTRAAFLHNPETAPGRGAYFRPAFETAAQSLHVSTIAAPVHNDTEIEAAITSLGREPGGGLVVCPDSFLFAHRTPIISLAARHNVPAIYWISVFVTDGGLLSYGQDALDVYHRSASYVDRVLRGAKPAELPVQVPTRYEMILNARAAGALGLTVPPSILLRADQVIE